MLLTCLPWFALYVWDTKMVGPLDERLTMVGPEGLEFNSHQSHQLCEEQTSKMRLSCAASPSPHKKVHGYFPTWYSDPEWPCEAVQGLFSTTKSTSPWHQLKQLYGSSWADQSPYVRKNFLQNNSVPAVRIYVPLKSRMVRELIILILWQLAAGCFIFSKCALLALGLLWHPNKQHPWHEMFALLHCMPPLTPETERQHLPFSLSL